MQTTFHHCRGTSETKPGELRTTAVVRVWGSNIQGPVSFPEDIFQLQFPPTQATLPWDAHLVLWALRVHSLGVHVLTCTTLRYSGFKASWDKTLATLRQKCLEKLCPWERWWDAAYMVCGGHSPVNWANAFIYWWLGQCCLFHVFYNNKRKQGNSVGSVGWASSSLILAQVMISA